jgi:hypothetical protein
MTITRRQTLIGAAATVAAVALPAVAIYDATIGFLVAVELSDADVGESTLIRNQWIFSR